MWSQPGLVPNEMIGKDNFLNFYHDIYFFHKKAVQVHVLKCYHLVFDWDGGRGYAKYSCMSV